MQGDGGAGAFNSCAGGEHSIYPGKLIYMKFIYIFSV